MAEQQCENCRFWDVWDEGEPIEITMGEYYDRAKLPDTKASHAKVFGEASLSKMTPNRDRCGWCLRMPPQCFDAKDGDERLKGQWPFTITYEWCGEWQPAES